MAATVAACPHCGKPASPFLKARNGCLGFVLVIIVPAVSLTLCAKRPDPKALADSRRFLMAGVNCKTAIRKQLRAPSTADFSEVFNREVSPPWSTAVTADAAYRVEFDVDAQNAFGAKLRQRVVCYTNYFASGDRFEVTSVKFLN